MENKTCQICGSDKGIRFHKGKQFLCGRHRQQLYHFGEIKTRTIADANTYIDRNNYHEIIIYDRNSKEKARTLIDSKDKEKAQSAGKWCLGGGGYPMNGTIKMSLHRFLLGKKKGLEIDHINGDKLDNRRSNLRFVNHRVNGQSWVSIFKKKIIRDFQKHIAEGKNVDEFFNELLK